MGLLQKALETYDALEGLAGIYEIIICVAPLSMCKGCRHRYENHHPGYRRIGGTNKQPRCACPMRPAGISAGVFA